jgi:hypothetical protein
MPKIVWTMKIKPTKKIWDSKITHQQMELNY